MDKNTCGNSNITLLLTIEKIARTGLILNPVIKYIDTSSNFQTLQAACEIISSDGGVIALISAPHPSSAQAMQSVGDAFQIPVFHYGPPIHDSKPHSLKIQLYVQQRDLATAVHEVAFLHYKWKSIYVMYSSDYGLEAVEKVLGDIHDKNVSSIAVRITDDNLQEQLDDFKASGRMHAVIEYPTLKLKHLLNKLNETGLLTEYYHYIFANLEMAEQEDWFLGESNITTFSPNLYKSYFNGFVKLHGIKPGSNEGVKDILKMTNMLIYDIIIMISATIRNNNHTMQLQSNELSCYSYNQETWSQGHSFINALRYNHILRDRSHKNVNGITGKIHLNGLGERISDILKIFEKQKSQLLEVGVWSRAKGVRYEGLNNSFSVTDLLKNKTLIITTIVNKPFTMMNESAGPGEEQFYGYCIDLLENIKLYLNRQDIPFKYKVVLVKDKAFGKPLGNGKWNGMVGELIRGEADMAVAPLTINHKRQAVIDLSTPFMNLGISILYRKQEKKHPGIFSFLKPLNYDIWIYLIVSYVAISLFLFLTARLTRYETFKQSPSEKVSNQFTVNNTLWFIAGAMMQQGSEINPRGFSTRIIAGSWWFFMLICIASYTANLAAFLTVTRMESPIKSAEDLSNQIKIDYGTVKDGSTQSFFRDSDFPIYAQMWQFMSNNADDVFVSNTEEGIARVLRENYAFLMESTMLQYQLTQHCNLTQIGDNLDSKYYGIGLKKDSPYTSLISSTILHLQDDGILVTLKKKWWLDAKNCKSRDSDDGDASALQVDSIGGIFYALILGTCFGMFVSVIELVYSAYKFANSHQISIPKVLVNNIKVALGFLDRDWLSNYKPSSAYTRSSESPIAQFIRADVLPDQDSNYNRINDYGPLYRGTPTISRV